jgi:hypothetical protein
MARASKRVDDRETRTLVRAVDAFSSLLDRFGVALVLLVMIVWTVKWLGNAKTQDDFIREVLFGEITGGRSLAIFFACMIVSAILGLDGVIRQRLTRSVELTRIAQERDRWRREWAQRAVGGHTDEEVP